MSVLVLAGLLAACSAKPVRLEVAPQEGVRTTYQRGAPLLHSSKVNRVILKLIDREDDDVLFGVAVENGQPEAFDLSTSDVHLAVAAAGGERTAGKVYSFDELPRETDTTLAWDSAQSVAGIAAMPIGGIWGSLARTVMQLGVRASRPSPEDEAGVDASPTQIEDVYLRRHTVAEGEEYRGLFVAMLPRNPESGEALRVTVITGAERHEFEFQFVAP